MATWFFIMLLFTAIPALAGFLCDEPLARGRRRCPKASGESARGGWVGGDAPTTCPHCQGLIQPGQADETAGVTTCPHCGLTIRETHRA